MKVTNKPFLAIETTGSLCSVCVYENEKKNLTVSLNMDRAHSKKILSLIDSAMSNFGIKPPDLGGICVSEGPGSFTGLRLGFAAAKGIAFGAGIGILKVPTFQSLAFELSEKMSVNTRGLIVTKAALEESYVYGFKACDDGFMEVFPLSLVENDKLLQMIQEGNYSKVYSNIQIERVKTSEKTSPDALSIVKYAIKKLNFVFDNEVDFIEPYYFKNFIVKVR